MNSESASMKKECNAELQKRKQIDSEVQKAQTELKRIKSKIAALEEAKLGKSNQNRLFVFNIIDIYNSKRTAV